MMPYMLFPSTNIIYKTLIICILPFLSIPVIEKECLQYLGISL
ncbi:hypothetical protein bcere0007_54820 [Bacillus mycoides]|nr:hypothetical protein bcere0007_54820 [Bacillus mycoides]